MRRTVDAEIASTTPRVTASAANSVLLQRESGIPVSAGRVQASAVIAVTVSAVNRRGRPVRGRSARPSRRAVANCRRHLRAVSTHSPSSAAIAVLDAPAAAASTIRARTRSRCSVRPLRARAVSTASSAAVSTTTNGLVTGIAASSAPTTIPAAATHRDHGVRAADGRSRGPGSAGEAVTMGRWHPVSPTRPRPPCVNG